MSDTKTSIRGKIVAGVVVAGLALWVSGAMGGDGGGTETQGRARSYRLIVEWDRLDTAVQVAKVIAGVETPPIIDETRPKGKREQSVIYRRGTGGIYLSGAIVVGRLKGPVGGEVVCMIMEGERVLDEDEGDWDTPASCSYDTGPFSGWF